MPEATHEQGHFRNPADITKDIEKMDTAIAETRSRKALVLAMLAQAEKDLVVKARKDKIQALQPTAQAIKAKRTEAHSKAIEKAREGKTKISNQEELISTQSIVETPDTIEVAESSTSSENPNEKHFESVYDGTTRLTIGDIPERSPDYKYHGRPIRDLVKGTDGNLYAVFSYNGKKYRTLVTALGLTKKAMGEISDAEISTIYDKKVLSTQPLDEVLADRDAARTKEIEDYSGALVDKTVRTYLKNLKEEVAPDSPVIEIIENPLKEIDEEITILEKENEEIAKQIALVQEQINQKIAEGEKKNIPNRKLSESNERDLAFALRFIEGGVDRIVVHGNDVSRIMVNGKEVILPDGEKATISSPDTDVLAALYLLNTATKGKNKKPIIEYVERGTFTEIVSKGSKKRERAYPGEKVLYIDTGGKPFSIQTEKGVEELFLDHHTEGRSKATSATQIVARILEKSNLFKEKPWLRVFVDFVTKTDNLTYVNDTYEDGKRKFNENNFSNNWASSLYGIYKYLPLETLLQFFEEGRDPWKPFTQEELAGTFGSELVEYRDKKRPLREVIVDTQKEVSTALFGARRAEEAMKEMPIQKSTAELGNVLYHNYARFEDKKSKKIITNKIPNQYAFLVTKALGYDTFAAYNPTHKTFFLNTGTKNIESTIQQLKKRYPGTTPVRGVMVFPPADKTLLAESSEEEFLKIIGLTKEEGPTKKEIKRAAPKKSAPRTREDNTKNPDIMSGWDSERRNAFLYNKESGTIIPKKNAWEKIQKNPGYYFGKAFVLNPVVLTKSYNEVVFTAAKLDENGDIITQGRMALKK